MASKTNLYLWVGALLLVTTLGACAPQSEPPQSAPAPTSAPAAPASAPATKGPPPPPVAAAPAPAPVSKAEPQAQAEAAALKQAQAQAELARQQAQQRATTERTDTERLARMKEEARASQMREEAMDMSRAKASAPPARPSAVAPVAPAPPRPAPQSMTLPDFPWPPPAPSAQLLLPDTIFRAAPSLAAVGTRLVNALEQARYSEYSYYRAPGGFALVARLERISENGAPLPEQFRFLQPGSQEPFSLATYVRELFFAPAGFYRQIVFVVSDQPFVASGAKIDAQSAAKLLSGGANRLSGDFDRVPFSPEHRVSALIYEFRKGARDGDVSVLTPGRMGARTHLDRAGIFPALVPGR